jgi:hypothetical protein
MVKSGLPDRNVFVREVHGKVASASCQQESFKTATSLLLLDKSSIDKKTKTA